MDEKSTITSFDQATFLANFQGMEDLAEQAISSFLEALPKMIAVTDAAIKANNAPELELAAHTLKGAISNFYAEPARHKAWQLEQIACGGNTTNARSTFETLVKEIEHLEFDLKKLSKELKASRVA